MKLELINTGTELLLGHTINTHLGYLGRELFPLGLRIDRQVTVPDGEAIRVALEEAFSRADIVVVTGGLGPTTDDITREITAELLGLELSEDADVLAAIHERFARRGLVVRERNKRQAMVPRGATVLKNPNGTAPGLYIPPTPLPGSRDTHSPHLFLLPGPPRELKPMFRDYVVPLLATIAPTAEAHSCRSYRLTGIGESEVEARVGERLLAIPDLELGYCARPGEVEVRVIGGKPALEAADVIVRESLSAHLVSTDERSLGEMLVTTLSEQGEHLALAESCTGGYISHRITNIPGASAVLIAGVVSYANEAKTAFLGVDPALIAAHGAVSEQVAAAMAEGAITRTGANYSLSTTGIAGPGGGSEAKPVGLVYIGCATKGAGVRVERFQFMCDRETFKEFASQAALNLLWEQIQR